MAKYWIFYRYILKNGYNENGTSHAGLFRTRQAAERMEPMMQKMDTHCKNAMPTVIFGGEGTLSRR